MSASTVASSLHPAHTIILTAGPSLFGSARDKDFRFCFLAKPPSPPRLIQGLLVLTPKSFGSLRELRASARQELPSEIRTSNLKHELLDFSSFLYYSATICPSRSSLTVLCGSLHPRIELSLSISPSPFGRGTG